MSKKNKNDFLMTNMTTILQTLIWIFFISKHLNVYMISLNSTDGFISMVY